MIVADSNGPRQAPNVFGDLSTALQATPDCLSGSQPHFIRSGSLRSASVCWNLLIFDGPERRNLAARLAFEGERAHDRFSDAESPFGFTECSRRFNVRWNVRGLRPHVIVFSVLLCAVRIDVFGLRQSNIKLRQQVK